MRPDKNCCFVHREREVEEGLRYAYGLPRGLQVPDPASRWQPDGVHKPSAVFSPGRFSWSDSEWQGIPREQLVIYELHVGTFTPEGTFAAIVPRLASLRELGVTAIEIMPVAQFPGTRDWGYDGVHPYAVQESYGGPHGLQELIDAAHREGLGVLLDVVYNHLGPEGNYLARFGPYFTDRYHTPWGEAINYDGPQSDAVRQFFLENARMWIRDFHADGLRLDAVQTIFDFSPRHILADVQTAVYEEGARRNVRVHVIAETDQNNVRLLQPQDRGGYGLDAVWSDDFHHAVHALLTGERQSYYEDFGTLGQVVKAFNKAFVRDGGYSRLPPPPPRHARGRHRPHAAGGLRAEPRPGGQSRPRRTLGYPAFTGGPAARLRTAFALALHAIAFHGRGVRRDAAVSFLLFLRRRRIGGSRAPRAAGGVPRDEGRRDSRSARGSHVRRREALLAMARRFAASRHAPPLRRALGRAAAVAGPGRSRTHVGAVRSSVRWPFVGRGTGRSRARSRAR